MGSTPAWLNTGFVLAYFGPLQVEARNLYGKFVTEAIERTTESPLKKAKPSLILGNKGFVTRINKTYVSGKAEDREVPAIRQIKGDVPLEAIQQSVERALGAKNKFARRVSVYITRKNTDHALKDIAEHYQISISGVGNIYRRVKKELGGTAFC